MLGIAESCSSKMAEKLVADCTIVLNSRESIRRTNRKFFACYGNLHVAKGSGIQVPTIRHLYDLQLSPISFTEIPATRGIV